MDDPEGTSRQEHAGMTNFDVFSEDYLYSILNT